jgi:hypothetical protein
MACALAIEAAGSNPILFGDSFLRSAYVVYDLENLEIGIAQTNFDSRPQSQDVQDFQLGSGMPNAASTANAASVAQTFTGQPRITAATATATGNIGGGTSRSATFSLVPTSSGSSDGGSESGSGGSSSSNAAVSHLYMAPVQSSFLVVGFVVFMSFLFGGSLLLM